MMGKDYARSMAAETPPGIKRLAHCLVRAAMSAEPVSGIVFSNAMMMNWPVAPKQMNPRGHRVEK